MQPRSRRSGARLVPWAPTLHVYFPLGALAACVALELVAAADAQVAGHREEPAPEALRRRAGIPQVLERRVLRVVGHRLPLVRHPVVGWGDLIEGDRTARLDVLGEDEDARAGVAGAAATMSLRPTVIRRASRRSFDRRSSDRTVRNHCPACAESRENS